MYDVGRSLSGKSPLFQSMKSRYNEVFPNDVFDYNEEIVSPIL